MVIDARPKKQKYELSTAKKVFEILKIISNSQPHLGISLTELSRNLKASKSTIHRYLQTLENIGVVERNERENYQIGWAVLELAGGYLSHMDLSQVAEPFIRELALKSKETVHLAIPLQTEVVYIGKADSPQSIRMIAHIGTRMPMYSTSLGKSMLAHMPDERVEEVIQAGLHRRTPHTLTTREELRSNLEKVRIDGYALDDVENELGVRCVGAPIFDYGFNVVGAVSISGPETRIALDRVHEFGMMVKETAVAISRRMGYRR